MDAAPGAKSPDPGFAMTNDDGRNEDYVLQVRDNTHKYMEALIQENERLRSLVSDLEEQRRQGEQQLGIAESERQKLVERIDQIEVESQSLLDQFQEIEQQNSDLASLYVASYRLHETIERSEVIAVIEEIVVNMIGSEELAIFELDNDTGKFNLVDSLGIDPEDLQRVRLNESRIEEAAEALQEVVKTGQRYVVNSVDGEVVDEDLGADRLRSPGARWQIDRSDRGVSFVGSEAETARPARLRTLRSTRDPRGLRALLLGTSGVEIARIALSADSVKEPAVRSG